MALTEENIDEIRETFAHFDKDSSGSIDKKELTALLEALGGGMSTREIEVGMKALDENGNGRIDFEEFLAWWTDAS